MTDFHLLRPWALLILLLLPALYWLLTRRRQQGRVWNELIPTHLQAAMLHLPQGLRQQSLLWWPLSVLAIGAIALAGPSWDKQPVPLFQLQQGKVLLLDLSDSMWATDLSPNRLTHARFKAQDLLSELDEGEMGLIAYAGDAFVLSPLSTDRSSIANMLPTLSPLLMPVKGSNLPKALAQADQLLRDAGHQQGEIILITDGVLPEYHNPSINALKQMPWQLTILALGSDVGAPMQTPDGELIRALDGSVALARTDYAALAQLATAGNGKLIPYQADGSDLATLKQTLALDSEGTASEQQQALWLDRGGYLLLLLAPLLAITLRRHALLAMVPLLLPLLMVSPTTEASPWQTADQQGQALFEQGDFANAATTFIDPAWQAAAHYRAGNYQQALTGFNQLEGVDALYNQGNALAKLGQIEQALERYNQVLEQQPDHVGAAANKQLLEQLPPEQPEQQQPDQSQQDQNQQDQQSQDQQGDGQSGQQQQQQGDSSERQSDGNDGSESSPPQDQQQSQSSPQSASDSQQNGAAQAYPQAPPAADEPQPPSAAAEAQDQPSSQQPQPEQASKADDKEASLSPSEALPSPSEPEPTDRPTDQAEANAALPAGDGEADERMQQLNQQLQQVMDDPSLLLRNKMQLEYERRRHQGEATREQTSW
ncbi:vWA domain-containing protein [Ferrimonas senticii]|uniref:vWA domain-containing protein n=1 Tax=Ferrimonas senticii TaxID=394566 RepID=UPI00041890BC|nr:VWA domain-containing protein [Ferrimonas senticii]